MKYAPLKSKYKLPAYAALDKDFELYTIECDEQILRNICKRIADKIEYFGKVFADLIQPENNIAGLHEVSFLSASEKKEVSAIYARLSSLHRTFLLAELKADERDFAVFILTASKEWGPLKKSMSKVISRLQLAWETTPSHSASLSYFG